MPRWLWACVLLLCSGWLRAASDWVFWRPAGWTAACQWSCNSGPYLCRSGFSASLSLQRSYCFTQYSSPVILRSSHVPTECNPVSDVYTLWCLRVYCGSVPSAQLSDQCLIAVSDSVFPTEIELTLRVTACNVIQRIFGCIKCSSVSQQLFREVRIMKLLNHPNIGKFTQEPAAARWQPSHDLIKFKLDWFYQRNQHSVSI